MSCFPCFRSQKSKKSESGDFTDKVVEAAAPETKKQRPGENNKNGEGESKNINAQTFTFRELASATRNFRQETLLGEGGFGRVYKGTLPTSGQVVAVKQLDRNGLQGNKEFLVEVLMLSQLHHDHLVKLVGYCADGDQRLLVYEYMPGGSVEDHLLDLKDGKTPLDWKTRMKIAFGAAQGLEYLHESADPPVIYRDLKSSNILLCENFHPKLSDFGLAKLSPAGDNKMHMTSRVMGTYGYCAPEYSRNGQLTVKSDVYSFGVVLLELITGRRAVDTTKQADEQNLVTWAQPIFRDPKKFPDMADPLLNKQFSETGLNQAVAIAAMCLQEEPGARPLISDVMTALSFLSTSADAVPPAAPSPSPALAPPPSEEKSENDQDQKKSDDKDEDTESDEDGSDYGDGESGGPEDANSATNSELDSSDDYSDCSDYHETENVLEGSKENKEEHQKSIKKNSISGRKNSRKISIKKASSGNESSSKNNSQNESSIVSSDRSSSGSEDTTGKSKSKKSSLFSLSRKSSKSKAATAVEGNTFKPSKKSHIKSLSSKSHRKSKKTKEAIHGTSSLKKPLDVREPHKSTTQQALPDAPQKAP